MCLQAIYSPLILPQPVTFRPPKLVYGSCGHVHMESVSIGNKRTWGGTFGGETPSHRHCGTKGGGDTFSRPLLSSTSVHQIWSAGHHPHKKTFNKKHVGHHSYYRLRGNSWFRMFAGGKTKPKTPATATKLFVCVFFLFPQKIPGGGGAQGKKGKGTWAE